MGLPTQQDIDRTTFLDILTEDERESLRELMIFHLVNIGDVRSLKFQGKEVVYAMFQTSDEGSRYYDKKTNEVAVRYERHSVPTMINMRRSIKTLLHDQ